MKKADKVPKVGDRIVLCRNKDDNSIHHKNRKYGTLLKIIKFNGRKMARIETNAPWGMTSEWCRLHQLSIDV